MYTCEKCGVRVIGSPPCCPLCQGPLTGEPGPSGDVYPDVIHAAMPHALLFRLLILAVVTAVAVCGAVLFCLPGASVAALSAMAGVASGALTVGIAVKKLGKPLKAVFWQLCLLSLLCVAWDFGTGFRGWSLDYVLPALYTCTMLAVGLVTKLLHMRVSDYMLYLVMNILLGLLPLLLLVCGALRVSYPAVICAAVSVVLLTALILFEGPALREELRRRLHL